MSSLALYAAKHALAALKWSGCFSINIYNPYINYSDPSVVLHLKKKEREMSW